MHLSRRALLGAGGLLTATGVGGGLVEHDLLPGRTTAHELLGLNGEAGEIPEVAPGPRAEGVLNSDLVDLRPRYWISYPPGTRPGDRMPVVVALHGAGSTAEGWCDRLGLDAFLAASGHRMAVAAVDGGTSSFWHERSDGQDAGRMLLEEFLPVLAERGLDLGACALLGWSMGGLGALLAGARLAEDGPPPPVLAVSPALWPAYDQAMPGAFDTEEQYDACMALVDRGLDLDCRVDCGTGDPFYRDVRTVLEGHDVPQHYAAGAHDPAYWTRVLPGQLDWLATRLSAR